MRIKSFGAVFGVAMFSVMFSAASSQAQTQKQRNVINNIAEVTAIDALCPTLKPNETLIAAALYVWKVDISTKKYGDMLRIATLEKISKLKAYDEDIICMSGNYLYGPNGQNVPNLLQSE